MLSTPQPPSPSVPLRPTIKSLLLPLHKLQRLLPRHDHHIRALLLVPHAVAFLRHVQHLRPKGRADELRPRAAFPVGVGLTADVAQVVGDGGAVLGVEVRVDFVEEVEGRRVALLDREDEGEGAEAWRMISNLLGGGRSKGGKEGEGRCSLFWPPLNCWIRC